MVMEGGWEEVGRAIAGTPQSDDRDGMVSMPVCRIVSAKIARSIHITVTQWPHNLPLTTRDPTRHRRVMRRLLNRVHRRPMERAMSPN